MPLFSADDLEEVIWSLSAEDLAGAERAFTVLFEAAKISRGALLAELSDESLAMCIQKGFFSGDAFEELLVNRYEKPLRDWFHRRVPGLADDLVQGVYVKLLDGALNQYDPCRPFRPWIWQVVRYHSSDERRRLRFSEPIVETISCDPSPIEQAMRAELNGRFEELLTRFPPLEQQILRGSSEGHTPEELAQKLGVSRHLVYRRLFRARRRLEQLGLGVEFIA